MVYGAFDQPPMRGIWMIQFLDSGGRNERGDQMYARVGMLA